MSLVVGIFVGGASSRMGRPKGLLDAPTPSPMNLVERLVREVESALPEAHVVLVGTRPEYEHLNLRTLPDEVANRGPLGGLVSLLAYAKDRRTDSALALACDLPYLSAPLIRRLAGEAPEAEVFCPKQDGKFQPLAARYSTVLLPAFRESLQDDKLALQPLVRGSKVVIMNLSSSEERSLADWDTPEDAGLL